jgi:sigma-B regulation protein RsbU (phosphoserine phosphatase)
LIRDKNEVRIDKMDSNVLDRFRSSLTQHRDELLSWLDSGLSQQDIHLGNTPVQDVLQVVSQLKDALERLNQGKFGICEICHEEVDAQRLELDYTASVCLEHLPEEQMRALERDLEMASQVQRGLLPSDTPSIPGVDIAVVTLPARIVSGDFFDFFGNEAGSQGLAIGDVMGKGLPASMLMSNLQASLRILGPEHQDPVVIARRLNELFLNNLKLIRFVSIFIGFLQPDNRSFSYCNAGHHPPLLWKNSSRKIQLLLPTGPAIGISRQPVFNKATISLNPGDILLLYTDGIIEARNISREEYGDIRLNTFLQDHHKKSAREFVNYLLQDVKQFSPRLQDDITLLALKVE